MSAPIVDPTYGKICIKCGFHRGLKNQPKYQYRQWNTDGDGNTLCPKCYQRLFITPRVICFKGKDILIPKRPRKGICERCKKRKITAIHHIKYHDNDVLMDTQELCISCHMKESWRLGSFKNMILNLVRDKDTGRFITQN